MGTGTDKIEGIGGKIGRIDEIKGRWRMKGLKDERKAIERLIKREGKREKWNKR